MTIEWAAQIGAARFSILLVELALVPVRPEQQTRNPRRRPAHLVADSLQGHARATLDDKLVVNAAHDEAVSEGIHGVCQNIHGHRLDEIFRDLRPIGLQPGPLPQVDSLVGHALGAKVVHADVGLDVGEPSAGRQVDEQHPALVVEAETVGFDRSLVHDRFLHGCIYIPPKPCNPWVCVPP